MYRRSDGFREFIDTKTLALASLLGLGVFALAWFGIDLTRTSGRIATVWFSNALLLAVILRHPARSWPLLMAFGFSGNIAANLVDGDDLAFAAMLSGCNMLEVLIAAALTRRFAGAADFRQRRPMLVLLGAALGPAVMTSTIVASSVITATVGADFWSVAATWYPADALGLITLAPILLTIDQDDIKELGHPRVVPKFLLSLAVLIATLAVVFWQTYFPFLFLVIPAMILVVWLLGYIGSAIAVTTLAIAAFVATLNDFGPIGLMGPDLRLRIITLQILMATSSLTLLAIAANRFDVQRLRAAIVHAPNYFYVKNRSSEFVAVNQNVAAIAGKSRVQDMIGKSDRDIVSEERALALLAEEQEIFTHGFALKNKLENITGPDGVPKWYETSKEAIRSETGRIIGLAGSSKDVTARKALQDEVAGARDQLALVLHEMSDGIAVVSADGYIVMCNERYQQLFPLTGKMRVKGAYFPRILLASQELGEATGFDPAEAMRKLRSGVDAEIQLSNGAILMMRSRPSRNGGWVVVVSDVTSIRRAEIEIRAMAEQLELLATTDGLTGLCNRRTLDERLEREISRCRRNGDPISLLMVDIDHFKALNDALGHQQGDECLRAVAQAIAGEMNRPGDFVARYGGEEFCVVLPETSEAGAFVLGERVRLAVEARRLENPGGQNGIVTISLGAACLVPDGKAQTSSELLERADQSLYVSKKLGRNRITGWSFGSSQAARDKLKAIG